MQVRADHQDPGPTLPGSRSQRFGHEPELVHGYGLEMLAEPCGQVAQAHIAKRLGQHPVARPSQRQQRHRQRPLGAIGDDHAVRFASDAQMG